jgi:hypothetical protein
LKREAQVPETPQAPGETAPTAAVPYEPPAVAWEEAFEPMAQTSCGLIFGMDENCNSRPST